MSKKAQLLKIAQQNGITVHFWHDYGNYNGEYIYKTHSVYVCVGKRSRRDVLYTLAHELGHAYYLHGQKQFDGIEDTYDSRLQEEIDAWNYATKLAKKFKFYNKFYIRHRNRTLGASQQMLKEIDFDS